MLTDSHKSALRRVVAGILDTALPILAHNSEGIAAECVVEDLRAEIDGEVRAAFNEYSRQRNTFVLVNRIPDECLLEVLRRLKDSTPMLTALQICGHWRSVLRSARAVWARRFSFDEAAVIYHHRPLAPALRTVTELSGGSIRTMHLNMPLKYYGFRSWPRVVAPVFEHLVGLYLAVNPDIDDLYNVALEILEIPAPCLEVLEFRSLSAHSTPVQLPANLFHNDAPNLSILRLRNAIVHFEECVALRSVHTLRILDMTSVCRTEDLARACSYCPSLEHLTVEGYNLELGEIPGGFIPPRLSSLSVYGYIVQPILELIVLANMSDSVLRILPVSVNVRGTPMPFVKVERVTDLIAILEVRPVHSEDTAVRPTTFAVRGDADYTCSIEHVDMWWVLETLVSARHRLGDVSTLTMSDCVLAPLLNSQHRWMADMPQLEHLTILFRSDAISPYSHLFCSREKSVSYWAVDCPKLRTVRLSSRHPKGVGKFYCDIVALPAELVFIWLPSTVRTLVLDWIRLDLIATSLPEGLDVVDESSYYQVQRDPLFDLPVSWDMFAPSQ